MKTHKNSILMAIGAALGVVAGLTLAQRKGKDLRKDLHKAFDEKGVEGKWVVLQKELAAVGREFIQAFREIGARPDVKDMVEKGKAKWEDLREEGMGKLEELKKSGTNKVHEVTKKASLKAKRKINDFKSKQISK